MEKIQWDDSLSVGVDLIDEQHKMLIKRIRDVHEVVSTAMAGASIAQTLDFLVDYTDFHFGTEERHMAAHEYPGADAHLDAHREFKATLSNLAEDFREEGATASLAEAIDMLLFRWLLKHIKVVDQELGRFVNDRGIEMEGDVE